MRPKIVIAYLLLFACYSGGGWVFFGPIGAWVGGAFFVGMIVGMLIMAHIAKIDLMAPSPAPATQKEG